MKRGGQMKRTQLRRKRRLSPGTGLARTGQITRARKAISARPPRDTGPGRRTRALVLKRDDWSCVACGRDISDGWPYSLQHRLARGQGGGSEPFNLIVLCGSATSPGCHRLAESRDPHMHAAGYYLESWQDPRAEPVMLHGTQGGVTVWLTSDGRYAFEPVSGAVA